MTLHKVSSQMEYGQKLISDAQSKLSELEAERDTLKATLGTQRPEDGQCTFTQSDLEALHLRVEAQRGILAVFQDTCGGGQADKLELAKLASAEEAWSNAKERLVCGSVIVLPSRRSFVVCVLPTSALQQHLHRSRISTTTGEMSLYMVR